MSFFALVSGTLAADPQARISSNGKPFATGSIRAGDGDDAVFVSWIAFNEHVKRLVDFGKGDALALGGKAKLTQCRASRRLARGRDHCRRQTRTEAAQARQQQESAGCRVPRTVVRRYPQRPGRRPVGAGTMSGRHNGAYCDARCLVCGARFPRLRSSRLTCSDTCRQKRSRALRANTPPFPDGKFDLIYVDPPWECSGYGGAWGKVTGRQVPYAVLDLPAICRLPVARLAAENSILAIWVFGAEPAKTLQVIRAWGFREDSTCEGLTWVKVAKSTALPYPGLGHTTRKDSESLWLARHGNGLPRRDKGVGQTIVGSRRENSRKPDEAYRRLERLYGSVRRIELFSRRDRPGWERWGNELLPPDAAPLLPFADDELRQELAVTAADYRDDYDPALDSLRSWEVGIDAMRERHRRNGGAT
jgi:N6-adenosine-specific RNA methylase IME4